MSKKRAMPSDRKAYQKDRARHLMMWESPDMIIKGRAYLASELKRISFSAWCDAYLMPELQKVLDKQDVPTDPKAIFKAMAERRPFETVWQELVDGKMPATPARPRRHHGRRT